jgi:hypothetical protein
MNTTSGKGHNTGSKSIRDLELRINGLEAALELSKEKRLNLLTACYVAIEEVPSASYARSVIEWALNEEFKERGEGY